MEKKIDLEFVRNQIIGQNLVFETPFGKRHLIYTDYSTSGSALIFIENYMQKIQRIHAISVNSGNITEKILKKLLNQAEYIIKSVFNADDECIIIPTGANLVNSILKFQEILGIRNCP
ncbi:MAG: aminotransferase class V-fold PLP-dependent enzyme, partial [Promethearchaeota archaeon]